MVLRLAACCAATLVLAACQGIAPEEAPLEDAAAAAAALAGDDACGAGDATGECSLSLRQLRGEQRRGAAAASLASALEISEEAEQALGISEDPTEPQQCSPPYNGWYPQKYQDCRSTQACCDSRTTCYRKNADWAACLPTGRCAPGIHYDEQAANWQPWECAAVDSLKAEATGSDKTGCARYGCGAFNRAHDCQCNSRCEEFDTCCSDYKAMCVEGKLEAAPPAASMVPPAPAPPAPPSVTGSCPPRTTVPGLPKKATDLEGVAWPALCFEGKDEKHVFAIGDWGGVVGDYPAHLLQYWGDKAPGPHTFGNKRGACSQVDMVTCMTNKGGAGCNPICGWTVGTDDMAQILVAEQLKKRAATSDPGYVLNVGDNYYWGGIEGYCGSAPMGELSSSAKQQFSEVWDKVYSGPGLTGKPWLSVLGNHDYGGRQFNKAWDQQIAFTWTSDRWVMPARYFSQRVEYPDQDFSIEYFMLDSNAMDAKPPPVDTNHNICSKAFNPPKASCAAAGGPASLDSCFSWFWDSWNAQKRWLETGLNKSTATWQVVVTHFPCGHQAPWYKKLHEELGLDLLITGHTHQQMVFFESGMFGGMTCFITGGGGGITSEAPPRGSHSNMYGFFDLTVTKETMTVESINFLGNRLSKHVVHPKGKSPPTTTTTTTTTLATTTEEGY